MVYLWLTSLRRLLVLLLVSVERILALRRLALVVRLIRIALMLGVVVARVDSRGNGLVGKIRIGHLVGWLTKLSVHVSNCLARRPFSRSSRDSRVVLSKELLSSLLQGLALRVVRGVGGHVEHAAVLPVHDIVS